MIKDSIIFAEFGLNKDGEMRIKRATKDKEFVIYGYEKRYGKIEPGKIYKVNAIVRSLIEPDGSISSKALYGNLNAYVEPIPVMPEWLK